MYIEVRCIMYRRLAKLARCVVHVWIPKLKWWAKWFLFVKKLSSWREIINQCSSTYYERYHRTEKIQILSRTLQMN